MQMIILVVSFVLMAIIAYHFMVAIRESGNPVSPETVESHQSGLIKGMVVFGVIITLASLWQWPHAISNSGATVTVNATGAQWYWTIDKSEISLGKPVVFNVHTEDVTHGLGVVNSKGQLLFQTQAMPGYVNRIEYVFTSQGTYKIICMEFCGIAHHDMVTEFEVVAN